MATAARGGFFPSVNHGQVTFRGRSGHDKRSGLPSLPPEFVQVDI